MPNPFSCSLPPLGTVLPEFRLLDHRGLSVGLSDFSDKKGVVLLFFASDWLKGDLELLQRFIEAHARFEAANIQVLALSSINWEKLHYLGKRLDCPFPILFDQCCRQATYAKAAWVPKFVSGRGVIVLDANRHVIVASGNPTPELVLKAFNS